MKEGNIQADIAMQLSKQPNIRVFRNNVGKAWVGSVIHRDDKTVTIANYRILHAGLCEGSSDLIGIKKIIITPDMVGQEIGVFLGVEVKTPTGRPSKAQLAFRNFVNKFGGKCEIVRNGDEALRKFV